MKVRLKGVEGAVEGIVLLPFLLFGACPALFVGAGGMWWWEVARGHDVPSYEVKAFGHDLINMHFPDGYGEKYRELVAAGKAQAAHTKQIVVAERTVTVQAAAAEDKAQAQIRTVYKTILQEVPHYVDPQVDRDFPLPVGLVRVHDAAALGLDVSAVPGPAGLPDDAPSPVKASDAASVIAGNYGECHSDQERLTALQDWITAEAKAFSAP